jgi:hypothetical protein
MSVAEDLAGAQPLVLLILYISFSSSIIKPVAVREIGEIVA